MSNVLKKYTQLTKDDIKLVAQQWESKSTDQIADELGCSKATVWKVAAVMRNLGWNLPKKRKTGVLNGLILEALDEM